MAFNWKATFVFTDARGNKTRRTYRKSTLGADLATEGPQVQAQVESLLAAYEAVSDASVTATLALEDTTVGGGAAAAGSDVSNVAQINLYIDPPPMEKLASLAIPAPIDAMFAGGAAGTDVDISNAALISLVGEFEADWEISDGENVDVSVTNGIKDGEWRGRYLNPR